MIQFFARALSVGCVFCLSSIAYSEINPNIDAKYGHRWSTVSPDDSDSYFLGSDEINATAGFRLGGLPLSLNADFGAILNSSKDLSLTGKMYNYTVNHSGGYEIAASVKGWLSPSYLIRTFGRTDIVPYIKIGHTIFSDYRARVREEGAVAGVTVSSSDHNVKSTSAGFNYNIGASFSLNETVGIVGEYLYTNRAQKDKISGAESERSVIVSRVATHGAFIGVEVVL